VVTTTPFKKAPQKERAVPQKRGERYPRNSKGGGSRESPLTHPGVKKRGPLKGDACRKEQMREGE